MKGLSIKNYVWSRFYKKAISVKNKKKIQYMLHMNKIAHILSLSHNILYFSYSFLALYFNKIEFPQCVAEKMIFTLVTVR